MIPMKDINNIEQKVNNTFVEDIIPVLLNCSSRNYWQYCGGWDCWIQTSQTYKIIRLKVTNKNNNECSLRIEHQRFCTVLRTTEHWHYSVLMEPISDQNSAFLTTTLPEFKVFDLVSVEGIKDICTLLQHLTQQNYLVCCQRWDWKFNPSQPVGAHKMITIHLKDIVVALLMWCLIQAWWNLTSHINWTRDQHLNALTDVSCWNHFHIANNTEPLRVCRSSWLLVHQFLKKVRLPTVNIFSVVFEYV